MELTKRVLSCIDFLARNGRTQIRSFFEAFSTTVFFTKTWSFGKSETSKILRKTRISRLDLPLLAI